MKSDVTRLNSPWLLVIAVAMAAAMTYSLRTPAPEAVEGVQVAPPSARYTNYKAAAEYLIKRSQPVGSNLYQQGLGLPISPYQEAAKQIAAADQRYSIPAGRMVSRRELAKANDLLGGNDWENLGPGFKSSGRVREVLVDPGDPNIIYAAAATGGLFKSTNGGQSWTAIGDILPVLRIGSLAMDPVNSALLYAGTGEVFGPFPGNGILRSSNGGATWEVLPATENTPDNDFQFVSQIAISSVNTQRIYAATVTGIQRSLDGGQSWERVFTVQGETIRGCSDIEIRRDQSNDVLIAACETGGQGRLLRNTNAEGTGGWVEVLTHPNMARTTIAFAPSNQDIVYAAAARPDSHLHAIYRSADGGASWTPQVIVNSLDDPATVNNALFDNHGDFCEGPTTLASGTSPQGDYDNIIEVDPVDPNIVWVGGIDLFRSNDGGVNWGWASYWDLDAEDPSYTHADHHVVTFAPGYNGTSNQTLYTGTDGGVQRTDGARAIGLVNTFALRCFPENGPVFQATPMTWTNLTRGLVATQFYHGMTDPSAEAFYLGGTQDNGTPLGTPNAGVDGWREILGGDGAFVAIDPNNVDIIFASTTQGDINKSTNRGAGSAGAGFESATNGLNDTFPFITPFVMDPSNSQTLWTAGTRLWRTTDQADNWSAASVVFDLDQVGESTAIAVSPSNSNLVLNGRSFGFILRNDNAGTAGPSSNWQVVDASQGNISSIVFDPVASQTVYATVSTLGQDHVLRSTDAGQTWAAIDRRGQAGGIPNIGAYTIAIDPDDNNRLFVGTDLGVFVSIDGGQNWAPENDGLTNVQIQTLDLVKRGNSKTLYAFSHGRGAYRISLNAAQTTPTPTPTPTATPTPTGTVTPSPTATVTPSPTSTVTPSPSTSPSAQPSPTVTPSMPVSPTPVPSATPTPTVVPTPTPQPTPGGVADTTVNAGASNVPFLSFGLRNSNSGAVELDVVSTTVSTQNGSPDRIAALRLYLDSNGDGVFTAGSEPLLASVSAVGSDGAVDFTLNQPLPINPGTTARFIVLVDFN